MLREREPAWERAQAYLAFEVDRSAQKAGGDSVRETTQNHVFGADNRLTPPNTTTYRPVVHLSTGCSGTYIGQRTLLTAAHCVVSFSTAQVRLPITITPYRLGSGTTAPDSPYLNHTVSSPAQIKVPNGYFAAIVASGGQYTGNVMPHDYAVIVFPAGASRPAPMVAAGYRPMYTNHNGSGVLTIAGYPGSGCPDSTKKPRICAHSGGAAQNGAEFLLTQHIDMSGGQSGGPWLNSSGSVVGINIASVTYHDLFECGFDACLRNYARRIDTVATVFVQAVSDDY